MTDDELRLPTPYPFFTRAQALARGETDRTLSAAVRTGLLTRVRHGAYARTCDLESFDERSRHLVLAHAALQQQRGSVALAGPSASLVRGYDVFGHDLDLVHVMRLDGATGRREAGVVHHAARPAVARRIELIEGTPVVGAADAVW